VFVLVASLVVSLGAGRGRHLGRDFDLACVASLAPVTVTLVAALWAHAVGPIGSTGRGVVLLAALGWGGALTAVALLFARRRVA
jgi:hypothetical protein